MTAREDVTQRSNGDTVSLVDHIGLQLHADADDEPWESSYLTFLLLSRTVFERKAPVKIGGARKLFPLPNWFTGTNRDVSGRGNEDPSPSIRGVQQTSAKAVNVLEESYSELSGSQPLDVVHWLPVEQETLRKAVRHYAADVTINIEMENVASASHDQDSHSLLRQPEQESRCCSCLSCPSGEYPSDRTMWCVLLLALVSMVACGLFLGLGAIILVIKARSKRKQRQHMQAQDLLGYALALIVISLFVIIPVYVYIFLYMPVN